MGGCPTPFVTCALAVLETEPVPIDATYDPKYGIYTLLFSTPLQPNPALFAGNWLVRRANKLWTIQLVSAAGSTVTINTLGGSAPSPGPDGISYSASIPDLLGLHATPAPPFSAFPW